jgi:hypothetical protein
MYYVRPRRPHGRLREANVSDVEVREIVVVIRQRYPGAIVNISGVTSDCPCQDGPACDSQVWVVADRDGSSNGLLLSRIGGHWTIGPVQEWWLEYEGWLNRMSAARRISDRAKRAQRYAQLAEEQETLLAWAPARCDAME